MYVACASQIVRHHDLWTRIYASVGLKLSDTLSIYLQQKDKDKTLWHDTRKSVKYKSNRKVKWTNKYKLLREVQMYDNKNGLGYETGMTMALARNRVKVENSKKSRGDS